ELDILENGKLDLPDDVLAEADYVVATIHYGLNQTERELTGRLVSAAQHRWIDAIGHPTGRLLGKRQPYPLDFDQLARAAAAAGCSPRRTAGVARRAAPSSGLAPSSRSPTRRRSNGSGRRRR